MNSLSREQIEAYKRQAEEARAKAIREAIDIRLASMVIWIVVFVAILASVVFYVYDK